jgi:hypothetical protein
LKDDNNYKQYACDDQQNFHSPKTKSNESYVMDNCLLYRL